MKQKRLTSLQRAEVKGRRIVELTSRKYLNRARVKATHKALNHLSKAEFIHDIPFELFSHTGPEVFEKHYWDDDFDSPWSIVDTHIHAFKTSDSYYDMMSLGGSCKDPFCDTDCPLTLIMRWGDPVVQYLIEEASGPAICRIEIFCPIPPRIETHLVSKGIILTKSYNSSSGSNQTINCPTH